MTSCFHENQWGQSQHVLCTGHIALHKPKLNLLDILTAECSTKFCSNLFSSFRSEATTCLLCNELVHCLQCMHSYTGLWLVNCHSWHVLKYLSSLFCSVIYHTGKSIKWKLRIFTRNTISLAGQKHQQKMGLWWMIPWSEKQFQMRNFPLIRLTSKYIYSI